VKILKWIIGLVTGLAGVVALFAGNKSKQKVKEIKKDIKVSKKKVKKIKTGIEAMEATQESYKKTLTEMKKKKETYKAPDVSGDEADKYIKDFLKKRKK
jgi:uncharacterized coiled-coil DUF342 family protein